MIVLITMTIPFFLMQASPSYLSVIYTVSWTERGTKRGDLQHAFNYQYWAYNHVFVLELVGGVHWLIRPH